MNEDETFRRLRRPNFNTMEYILKCWEDNDSDPRPYRQILIDNGWTTPEYAEEMRRHWAYKYDRR